MSVRIPRGSETDRHLRGLGWRRTRRRRRGNAKQPEVWKARKVWEAADRELIVRIVRHGELYRAEVLRMRHAVPWWQPMRGCDMASPLALAMYLSLEGEGDPVKAAYQSTKQHVDDESDWIRAPQSQAPRVRPRHPWGYNMGVDSFSMSASQMQAMSRVHRAGQEQPVVVDELDYGKIERRLMDAMQDKASAHLNDALAYGTAVHEFTSSLYNKE